MPVRKGDRLIFSTAGAGGLGDPLDREPERVADRRALRPRDRRGRARRLRRRGQRAARLDADATAAAGDEIRDTREPRPDFDFGPLPSRRRAARARSPTSAASSRPPWRARPTWADASCRASGPASASALSRLAGARPAAPRTRGRRPRRPSGRRGRRRGCADRGPRRAPPASRRRRRRSQLLVGDEPGHARPAVAARQRVQLLEQAAVTRAGRAPGGSRASSRRTRCGGGSPRARRASWRRTGRRRSPRPRRCARLAATPRSSAGRTTSSRKRGLCSGCTSSPSATSPATSIIRSRTAARYTGGAPCGWGRGRKAGGISVCEVNSPRKSSGSPVSHAARSRAARGRTRASGGRGATRGRRSGARRARATCVPSPRTKRPPVRSCRFQAV